MRNVVLALSIVVGSSLAGTLGGLAAPLSTQALNNMTLSESLVAEVQVEYCRQRLHRCLGSCGHVPHKAARCRSNCRARYSGGRCRGLPRTDVPRRF